MSIRCQACKQTGKGRYSSFYHEGKIVTVCDDCRWGKKPGKSDDQRFNELQIPFWKLMGQKPKPKDIAYEKYLKSKNMTYGDAVRLRNLRATNPGEIKKVEKYLR